MSEYLTSYGLQSGALRVYLRALPSGHPASADPDNQKLLPVAPLFGPGGEPIPQPAHLYAEDVISLDLEEVPGWQFEAYRDFVDRLFDRRVAFTVPGDGTFGSEVWTLISTTEGWVETRHGRWSGHLELWKRGTA